MRILFIPSGAIGDALMMIVLAQELHELDPELTVTIIARRNAVLITDLARAYPFIRVVRIGKSARGALTLLWEAIRYPYAVLMPAVFAPGRILSLKNLFYLLRLRRGTVTSGLVRGGEKVPYQASVRYDATILHFDNMRKMSAAAGLKVKEVGSIFPVLRVNEAEQEYPIPAPYVVIHPFGSSSWKSWPPRRTRELIELLCTAHPSLSILVTGGPENAERAAQIVQGFPRAYALTGLPILKVAATLRAAALYIGVDTGITHLACLMQIPSVLLEHNASPEWDPGYNPRAIALTNRAHCLCNGHKNGDCRVDVEGEPYHSCLYEISNDSIAMVVEKVLSSTDATIDAHGTRA